MTTNINIEDKIMTTNIYTEPISIVKCQFVTILKIGNVIQYTYIQYSAEVIVVGLQNF